MSRPYCYVCMHLPVATPGELCARCYEGWEPPKRKNPTKMPPLSEWSLDMLVATQEKGTVPGQAMYERHESTFSDLGMS